MSVNSLGFRKGLGARAFRWSLTILSILLLGCTEDPFSDDPIDDLSYPDLNHLNIPDSTAQPHSVFNSTASIESSINTSRQQEMALYKQLWEAAQRQTSAQEPIENSFP
ncbi:MAG: hypothetical protein LBD15_03540 [Holosporales bacterium]|jgi:hypothetical protein|nr:hypothetical protein [Holosporales bacterium]